ARASQLNMVWPTPEQFTKDAYALDILGNLLSDGKKSPLYKVLVKEKELTSQVNSYNSTNALASKFYITITANTGKKLSDIEAAIFEAFERFEKDGISDRDMQRVKAGIETSFYNGISSVFGKAYRLSWYNTHAGDPAFISKDIANTLAVTKEEVMAAYNKYIKGKHYVATSFVPKGQLDMIADNSVKANVIEEEIKENQEENSSAKKRDEFEKTASKFDRSKEPEIGPTPSLTIPTQWSEKLANGLTVFGIEQTELPMVQFSVVLKGGKLLDYIDKVGVANLMTDIMMEGTKNKTPEQLEEEIALLGSSIRMFTDDEDITVQANALSRNYEATLKLVEEILLEPRWDEEEFARIKTRTLNTIKQREANPNSITANVFDKLLYGDDNVLGQPTIGLTEVVETITIDDLKDYYNRNFSPSIANFHVTGNVSKMQVMNSLASIDKNWAAQEVKFPNYSMKEAPDKSKVYFVDVPDAKQSVINIGYLTIPRTSADYYPAYVMNYKLGGSFSGSLNLILREEKGYTYGARSGFRASTEQGAFVASSSVRSNVTYESAKIFKEEMEKYRDPISNDDLEFTKNALIKSNPRRFETLGSLLSMLETRSMYKLPADYIKTEENIVKDMTVEQHKKKKKKYIKPDQMYYLVTGDKKTQMDRLKGLGFGKPIELDRYGNPPGDKSSKDNDKRINLSRSKK
ncbi:MAG: insulinase family protein, partial [Calditrichaeota bacterium]|nr:insulinase family protein [Calditrichota bacterium]